MVSSASLRSTRSKQAAAAARTTVVAIAPRQALLHRRYGERWGQFCRRWWTRSYDAAGKISPDPPTAEGSGVGRFLLVLILIIVSVLVVYEQRQRRR